MEETQNPQPSYRGIKDLEETQRILKDRLILIGDNLIQIKKEYQEEILELKKDMEIMKNSLERIKSFLESFSSEIKDFAKKSDIEILRKQAKMFQPLEFVKRSELDKFKKK
jgi:hypothetical protein